MEPFPDTSPCMLCPRECGARRAEGQRGRCGADARMFVARSALHFWEEPPISGDAGSGAVFFSLCPVQCVYCQNHVIAQGRAGKRVDAGQLAQMCLDLQGQGAMNVNFVTPTHYAPWIAQALAQARSRGLEVPAVWNTSGYEKVQAIRALEGTVDVYLADFKYADAALADRYSSAPDYPDIALDALFEMLVQAGRPRYDVHGGCRRLASGVVVRHLLLPGALEASKQALRAVHERFGDDVLVSIMNQYTPLLDEARANAFPELARKATEQEYEELLDFADSLGMSDYFWQDGPAADESFVPAWEGDGIG